MKTTAAAMRLFLEGSVALAQIEQNGMRIDVPYLDRTISAVKQEIAEKTEQLKSDDVYKLWQKTYRGAMKFDASEQLGTVLFEKMGYECKEVTEKSKKYKSDKANLLKTGHPFVPKYVEVKELKKVLDTNLVGIKRELVGDMLRPFFHLDTVRTFRSSSSNPNFHNFPNRNPRLAEMVRRCFIPREDHVLLEADFKAVEVAVAACVTKDPNLIKYVCDSKTDMHRDTAMQLFFLKKEQVDKKTTRDWAKNRFVFPQFYGSVFFQCAPHLWEGVEAVNPLIDGVPLLEHLRKNGVRELGDCESKEPPRPGTFLHHVKKVEEDFWGSRFKVYAKCKRQWWDEYQKKGGFGIATGFHIEGLYERNQINNYRVQGPAFHCLLFTLIETVKWLRKNKMRSLISGQIHDCVNSDSHRQEWQDVAAEMVRIVREDLPKKWPWLVVPMTLELELAERNWYEKKEVKL
jgi:DNA polymerase I-like protein with 3'-5' exonuclease and polymerase domains